MLTREDLTSERIDQIVADARAAGYDFFLSSPEREASLNEALLDRPPGEETWVFAYGSLMWNPALEYAEVQPSKVEGWRRSFCFWTPMGRGTPELPGLMLALADGGACEGIAYRLSPDLVRQRTGHPVEPRDAGGRLPAALGADQAAGRAHRQRRSPSSSRPGTASIAAICRSSAPPTTSPSPRAAAAPAATTC